MTLLKLAHGQLLPALEEPLHEVLLKDWRANPHAHADATALVITNGESIMDVAADLNGFDIVILDFPAFTDGRAYSQARLLRERLSFSGEIRARGNILRDQVFFMVRCGFNAFEFDGQLASDVALSLNEFSLVYQSAGDEREPIWRKRTARAAAA
ncbi:MAG: DUF934 domain-containing protein [Alphaproteobacteria bacterium]|nr:DUF934 domain-containing protein [Alphaproteobacteria bacterium]